MTQARKPNPLHTGIVIAVVMLSLGAAVTQVHAAPDAAFGSASQLFGQAVASGGSAIDKAADEFDALFRAEPTNPVLMAYAGAATALKSRNTWLPWKKMSHAEDGLALIDKALAMLTPEHDAVIQHGTPGSLEVRFVAASAFVGMPDFMNRGPRGAKLLAQVLASPLFAQAPLPFQGAVWMTAAAQASKEDRAQDAQRYLNEVISRNAPQAERARALLKGAAA
jgi:hypothetical protein